MAVIPPLSGPSVPPTTGAPVSPARVAAQRAFFEAALGRAGAAPTASAAAAVGLARAQAQPIVRTAAPAPAEPPSRPLRPGSLLDIKV